MKRILLIALTFICFCGCKKSELMQYQGGNNIYFNYVYGTKTIADYYEEIDIPFGPNLTTSSYDVVFDVDVLGNLEDRKRPFQMTVNKKTSTAIEGVHYILPLADSLYIAPGKANRQLTIKILRAAVLRDNVAYLDIDLVPNTDFQTGMNTTALSGTGQRYAATTIHIKVDDILLKPVMWDASVSSLGTWSREKLEIIVEALDVDITYFYVDEDSYPYTAGELATISRDMQMYLNTQKSLGHPIYEKDGTEMIMGPNAQ